jgi:hypothetical protein
MRIDNTPPRHKIILQFQPVSRVLLFDSFDVALDVEDGEAVVVGGFRAEAVLMLLLHLCNLFIIWGIVDWPIIQTTPSTPIG